MRQVITRQSVLPWILLLLGAAGALAAPDPSATPMQPLPAEQQAPAAVSVPGADKAAPHEIYAEDFEGGPGDWTSHDLSISYPHWQKDTFYAENLDAIADNHAWWCGEEFTSCDGLEDPRGYGPLYDDVLEWSAPAPDPDAPTLVRVTAILNHDVEPGYDYLYLEYSSSMGWMQPRTWNGTDLGVPVDETFTVDPGDYVDGAIELRWRVTSDGGWDQSDCSFANEGAAQIDNIAVYFEGSMVGSVETCESGATSAWGPAAIGGVGDYAQLTNNVPDLGTCADRANESNRWIFIDDGVVVPETGGTPGVTWQYGPGGYVPNPVGGLAGAGAKLWNEVWSPPIVLDPVSVAAGCIVGFDLYLHVPMWEPDFPGIFPSMRVRSSTVEDSDPDTNPEQWSEWMEMSNYLYYGGPYNTRFEMDVSTLLVEGCRTIQVALGVRQRDNIWGWDAGTDGTTPAPYYDNVTVRQYDAPFRVEIARPDLAQDAFPESFAAGDPGNHDVRFDSARNLQAAGLVPDFGDSLVIRVTTLPGAHAAYNAELHTLVVQNPAYEPYRSVPGGEQSYPCSTADGVVFWGEPEDYDNFQPGDVVHYWFEVTDGFGHTATLPADLTAREDFSTTTAWPEEFTWHALPSVQTLEYAGAQPRILLWDASDLPSASNDWPLAMLSAGLDPGLEYDRYVQRAAGYAMGNGLGRYSIEVLKDYETIIVATGAQYGTVLNEQDLGKLVTFLDTSYSDHSLILSGNRLVSWLQNCGYGAGLDLLASMGVALAGYDLAAETGTMDQSVVAIPGTWVFADDESWTVTGSCPVKLAFDQVTTTDAQNLAEYVGPGAYPYTAGCRNVYFGDGMEEVTVFTFPYDLTYVDDPAKADKSLPVMTALLEEIFLSLDYGPVPNFLQECRFQAEPGAVEATWRVYGVTGAEDFRLQAEGSTGVRIVPHQASGAGVFTARDEAAELQDGERVRYTLSYRDGFGDWQTLYREEVDVKSMPRLTALHGAFPNPFNPRTEVSFSLDQRQRVDIAVHDLAGRRVATLAEGEWDAGRHVVVWDGATTAGGRAASGTYLLRMTTDERMEAKKIMLVK